MLDTVGPDTFNVGEYWVDLRCAPTAQCNCQSIRVVDTGSVILQQAAISL